jgi:hypothetical protein
MATTIDIGFDFRRDANGRDPDSHSPTLRRYHQFLWNKPLPCGSIFELSTNTSRAYLYHHTALGEFRLSSDSVMATFTRRKSMKSIIEQFPIEEIDWFNTITYTVGGMMIFPSNQVNHQMTINAARGLLRPIADRFDLTLECIRRYYVDVDSPMAAVLSRYSDFFALFKDFHGYVNFFLLDDLVAEDCHVKFFTPFDDFQSSPIPKTLETYREYRRFSIKFVEARNSRIDQFQSRIDLV